MTSFTSQHSSHPAPSASSRSSKAQDNVSSLNGIKAPDPASEPATTARKLARLSLTSSRRQDSIQNLRENLAREAAQLKEADLSGEIDSPLSAISRRQDAPRRSHTISAAPNLPTLPSESIIARRATVRPTPVGRRPKTSNGGGSSVRGAPLFPALSVSGEPTTAVSTTSAQASPERPRATTGVARTFSRASGAALAGLQQQMERDRDAAEAQRRRTTSANSALESEVARQARRGYESERAQVRVGRASLDSNREAPGVRERRSTMTGIFTRA